MLKIGLTGGIGSGKSTVSEYIKELGFDVIDADIISREVLLIYPEILQNIRKQFGDDFFDEKGELNRRKLGNLLFRDKNKLAKYENIILPKVEKEIFHRIEQLELSGKSVCFLDAATLIEKGMHKSMDKNILIWVDKNTQISRVFNRDKMDLEDVNHRINSQMNLDEKKKYVDFVVNNSGRFEATKKEVFDILKELKIIKREVNLS
jgi:dephospho-CoA kinase